MSLQATRRKHCDQAHPYQRNLKDGISLFGRETPAYILEEVNRRQLVDRGTSSLWAKLAADYGPRHANFIVKHDTKFPISRNDRNSWSNIVQEFTEKKRIRPVSAPNTRQELQGRGRVAISSNNRCIRNSRAASARARLIDIAARKDEPMPVFQRSAEIQAVVGMLHGTRVARLRKKLKKGERRKAAQAASRAESLLPRQSDTHRHTASSHHSSASAVSRSTSSGQHRVPAATSGAQRRQQNPTSRRGPSSPKASFPKRQPTSKARPRTASAVRSTPMSHRRRPRSAGSGFRHRTPNLFFGGRNTDTDNKLGIPRVRSRIYSFGKTATASGRGGGGHQEAMLRATSCDAERRANAHDGYSAASAGNAKTPMPRRGKRGEQRCKSGGGVSSTECLVGEARNRHAVKVTTIDVQTADAEENDVHANGVHLGAIDISKLTTVLGHEEVRGDNCTTNIERSDSDRDGQPTGGVPRKADGGEGGAPAARGDRLTSRSKDGSESDTDEEDSPTSELSTGGEGSTASGSGGSSEDDGGEDGGSLGADKSEAGGETVVAVGKQGRTGGVVRGGSVEVTVRGTPPRIGCLRGRYSRAATKSKSAFDAARAVTATAITTKPAGPHTSTSASAASAGGLPLCSTGHIEESSRAMCLRGNNIQKEQRATGARGTATVASWRDKLAAVQRRRAALECSMRDEAKRLVESRAEKQARVSVNASVSTSVSVRGATGFLGLTRAGTSSSSMKKIKTTRSPTEGEVRAARAATTIQRAFRESRQTDELWLGDQRGREYVAHVGLSGEREDELSAPNSSERRLRPLPSGGSDLFSSTDDGSVCRSTRLYHRHVAARTKRMVRGFICCTQARYLLLQLLWERTEGNILGERRTKRAAVESRAAATIQQLSHIRRIAVGLIKMQSSAKMFKMEHQSRQAKRNPKAKASERLQGGQAHGGGGRTFEVAQQARSEKQECEAILREHGRRGRRLVAVSVRDKFLRELLYSYRRQHIIRDQTEYLMETSRPPFVDSRDIKRMLACPDDEMHKFSDPKNYRTRPRYTRLALPLREIEGLIQDTIASHVKSEYRDKLKETLGDTSDRVCGADPETSAAQDSRAPDQLAVATSTAAGAFVRANGNAPAGKGPAERRTTITKTIAHQQRQQAEQTEMAVPGSTSSPTTATPSSSRQTNDEPTAATSAATATVTAQKPVGTTATMAANEERGWRRRRGGFIKVVQLAGAVSTA